MDGPEYNFIVMADQIPHLISFLNSQIAPFAVDNNDGEYAKDFLKKIEQIVNFRDSEKVQDIGIPIILPTHQEEIIYIDFLFTKLMSRHNFFYINIGSESSNKRFLNYSSWRKIIRFFSENIKFVYGYAWTHMSYAHEKPMDFYTQIFQQILLPHGTMLIPINILKESKLFDKLLEDSSKFYYFQVFDEYVWIEYFLPLGDLKATNESPLNWEEEHQKSTFFDYWYEIFEPIQIAMAKRLNLESEMYQIPNLYRDGLS